MDVEVIVVEFIAEGFPRELTIDEMVQRALGCRTAGFSAYRKCIGRSLAWTQLDPMPLNNLVICWRT